MILGPNSNTKTGIRSKRPKKQKGGVVLVFAFESVVPTESKHIHVHADAYAHIILKIFST